MELFLKEGIKIPGHELNDIQKNIDFLKNKYESILDLHQKFHKRVVRYKAGIKVIRQFENNGIEVFEFNF